MEHPEKRYTIREVSDLTDVPDYVLRQWERRFPELRPDRNRAKRRVYTQGDIAIIRRIKQLLRYEKLSTEGARIRLAQELKGEGRPKTRKEVIDLLDDMENQIRILLDSLDET